MIVKTQISMQIFNKFESHSQNFWYEIFLLIKNRTFHLGICPLKSSILIQIPYVNVSIQLLSMTSVLSVLKKGLIMTDFFYSTHFLRFQRQNEHRTVTGGLISSGIIIVIIAGFARMIFDTFSLNTIAYASQIQKETVPSQTILTNNPEEYSMFGIQISAKSKAFNLSSPGKYFDLVATYKTFYDEILKEEIVQLQGCTRQHWKTIENLVQNFDKLGVSNWLCPKIGQNISLKGKYSSKAGGYSFMQIKAKPCVNGTDQADKKCAPGQQIVQAFYQNEFTINGKVFFINTIINPNQPSYLSYYVEDKAYFSFTYMMGSDVYLQFSGYDIETDNSIWPFSSIKKDEGYIVQDSPTTYPFYRLGDSSTYFTFNFVKSDSKFHYNRQVQKISEVLSYIGGLIGAIIAFLFIINSFTNYSYQVLLACSIFSHNKQIKTKTEINDPQLNQQELTQKESVPSPNFFQFVKSGIYELLSQMKKSPNWPGTERISEYRKEILSQLNIKSILNRLIFIEFCLEHLFESYELCQLQQARPVDPKRVKQIRQKMDGEKAKKENIHNPKEPKQDISQNKKQSLNSYKSTSSKDMELHKITIENPNDKVNTVVLSINSIKGQQPQFIAERDSAWLAKIGKDVRDRKSFKLIQSQHQKGDKKSSRILKTIINHEKQVQFSKQKQRLKLICMDGDKKDYFEEQESDFSQIPVDLAEKPAFMAQNQ